MLGETLSPQILKKYGIEEYSPQEGKETPPESPAKKAKVVAPEPVAVPELTPEPVVAPEPVAVPELTPEPVVAPEPVVEEAKQKVTPKRAHVKKAAPKKPRAKKAAPTTKKTEK